MKVFLIKDVPNLGKTGQVKEVQMGYAKNFLLAKGFAVLPNDREAKEILASQKMKKEEQNKSNDEQKELAKSMNGKKIVFTAKADKNGHLYGSIGPKEIAKSLNLSENLIKTHFKELGVFPLEIRFNEDLLVVVEIEIKREK